MSRFTWKTAQMTELYKPAEGSCNIKIGLNHRYRALSNLTEKNPIMMHNKPESNDGNYHLILMLSFSYYFNGYTSCGILFLPNCNYLRDLGVFVVSLL